MPQIADCSSIHYFQKLAISGHFNFYVRFSLTQIRLFNNYNLSSNWSPVEVLPLDEWCDVTMADTTSQGPRVSVYYESDDREREQVLEFGCEASSFYSGSDSLATRLQQINIRCGAIERVKLYH